MKTLIYILLIISLSCCSETRESKKENLLANKNTIDTESIEGEILPVQQVSGRQFLIDVPDSFKEMNSEAIKLKYPVAGRRPTKVFTNKNQSINIAFNHTQTNCQESQLTEYQKVFENQFNQPNIEFLSSEIEMINGKKFIVLEFISPVVDGKVFNRMFMTSLDSRLFIGTINCTMNHFSKWKVLAKEITSSFKIQ